MSVGATLVVARGSCETYPVPHGRFSDGPKALVPLGNRPYYPVSLKTISFPVRKTGMKKLPSRHSEPVSQHWCGNPHLPAANFKFCIAMGKTDCHTSDIGHWFTMTGDGPPGSPWPGPYGEGPGLCKSVASPCAGKACRVRAPVFEILYIFMRSTSRSGSGI